LTATHNVDKLKENEMKTSRAGFDAEYSAYEAKGFICLFVDFCYSVDKFLCLSFEYMVLPIEGKSEESLLS
jgi:hypothetical protein